jgi:hypothetical protein
MRNAWLIALLYTGAHADPVWIGRFDTGNELPPPWQLLRFDNKVLPTRYQVRDWDGVPALEALADNGMALLARPIEIDLAVNPVLCWRWRVEAPLTTADLKTKSGDDYAARVYVTFTLPKEAMSLATRTKLALGRARYGDAVPDAAVNYVWDNKYPVGTQSPSAYTDRTHMLVLRSGRQDAGKWQTERRNVRTDLQSTLKLPAEQLSRARIGLVAVGTDTDNTHELAHAGFADLHFVDADRPCAW